MYTVTDSRTGQVVRTFQDMRAAHRYADRMDAQYGAVRYVVARVKGSDWGAAVLAVGAL